ncbi:MAG: sigma-70 family RNA polymerase sigma factor [Gemmatimonadota bacterium]|nr:MAG: sigma-70 family RNA polymerase sigma factor [Gemmatimonadota bacterium]
MEFAFVEQNEASERALVQRARAGDRRAFGELVTRYMRRAYYAALGLVGSHEDALDLSQEAFARAFRARANLDPELPFYGYLYQIVRRLCFNFLRDSRTRRVRMEEATPWLMNQAGAKAAAADPGRSAERSELCAQVQAAIERLPEREREVLVLKEFEGLRYREIAELLGIPIGTVMSRLYTARRNLAAELEGVL